MKSGSSTCRNTITGQAHRARRSLVARSPKSSKERRSLSPSKRGNVSAVARDLGIVDSALHRWKAAQEREAQGTVKRAFPGRGNPQDAELAQLKRDNARLKEENEILKKAVGIFTKGQR